MLRIIFTLFLMTLAPWSSAKTPDSNHHYITSKIAMYSQAFDRCKKAAESRSHPSDAIIEKLKDLPRRDVERFLMSKSILVLHECEKPEITELAYAIVITEGEDLQRQTIEAISAIKILAFSGAYRKFKGIYQSVPEDMRRSLEGLEYFDRPFDDRLLLDVLQ